MPPEFPVPSPRLSATAGAAGIAAKTPRFARCWLHHNAAPTASARVVGAGSSALS
jgi:hypothetical protein